MNGTFATFAPGGPSFKVLPLTASSPVPSPPLRAVLPAAPCPRREDRWSDVFVARRRAGALVATGLVLLASAALHGALVATALFVPSAPRPAPPTEITVEVVPEPPKSPEPVKAASPAPPPQTALQPASPPAKPVEAKPPQALTPTVPPLPPEASSARQRSDEELKAMQNELAQLKAEHDALEAERATIVARPSAPAGLGPLPDSFQAVALPGSGEDGEAVGYSEIVFSQLAKAMEVGTRKGVPGSSGVRFVLDEKGALVDVELVRSSGIKQLDEEAVEIVRRAAPFPPPPQGAQRDFSANVSFVAGASR